MTHFNITLKSIFCTLIMFYGLTAVQATQEDAPDPSRKLNMGLEEKLLNPHRSLFELHRVHEVLVTTQSALTPLKSNIDSILKIIPMGELQEGCQREFHARCEQLDGPMYQVGLYCVINLSTTPVTFSKRDVVSPGKCSIFSVCYDQYAVGFPFEADNTLFLSLGMQDYIGNENSFVVQEKTMPPSSTNPHQVLIFGEAAEKESAKQSLLGQFARYARENPNLWDERKSAFPHFSRYIENPETYEKSIQDQNVVFTYERTID